ncbi:MAG TPA: FliH/SctL family protein [Candidatus Hydrogenedentes bacterium]|nr:FliH/SctL family protein [Candidatus Hydrogenedentota bacterium]HQE83917.1 FliH/SctL family protein [Candidatus Hydrogenedentota bacterium]HQM48693.1 FliH/SctL family protein [Candidatus Hydrogenedentota bacterium]
MARIIKCWEPDSVAYPSYQREALELLGPGLRQNSGDLALDPRQIIDEARKEAELKVREAYAEGLRRGTEAGRAHFEESVGKAAEALESAASAIQAAHEQFLQSLEPQVAALAAAIAKRIVRREPSVDPERVRTTVREALGHFEKSERITLRLSPADLAAMEAQNIRLLDEFTAIENLEVVADETVAPGGCVAESEYLEVDAQIDTQLQKIFDDVLE